jgi:4-hydroxybenzoyl-CoA thioesterase
MSAFVTEIPIRFGDCDPAGIVFYPRYFEMFNSMVEDWCEHGWGLSFKELIMERGWGLPTVHLETDFVAPSTLGERLTARLSVLKTGSTSIHVAIRLVGPDGADRVRAQVVLVLTDRAKGKAMELPAELKERIAHFIGE